MNSAFGGATPQRPHSEKSAWLTILAVEAASKLLTSLGLYFFGIYSLAAELYRTPLRLAVVLVYWRCLRSFIPTQGLAPGTLRQPGLLLALGLFLCVPLLVGDLSYMTPTTRWVYAVTSLVVALREEIAFRALIQTLLARRFGQPLAIVGATALFTVFHIGAIPLTSFAYGQVLLASVFLGIIYARTQNLWLVVGLHALYDALWSATPVLRPPLPYVSGLGVLLASTLWLALWSRRALAPQPGSPGR